MRPNQTALIYMGSNALADLPAKVATRGFISPSLLIVGDVVKLHGSLHWFDSALGDDSRLTHSGPVQLPINPVAAN